MLWTPEDIKWKEGTLLELIPWVWDWLFGPQNTSLLAPSGTHRHCLTPLGPMTLVYKPWKTHLAVSSKVEADQLTPKDSSHDPQTLPQRLWQRLTSVTLL